MNNLCSLTAQLIQVAVLRYTPAGLPVLDVVLKHHSYQEEAGAERLVECEITAKILGKDAQEWQHSDGSMVEVTGFLAQKSLRNPRLVLHIQTINLCKG